MASNISWSNGFSSSATDFEFFMNIWCWVLEIYLWGKLLHLWLWVHCGMISDNILKMLQKGKGFSSRCCCKAKLLFHIQSILYIQSISWYSGEQVSELFWACFFTWRMRDLV
jgi:hypothetical protein